MRERGLPRAAGCEPDGLPRAGRWQHAAATGLPQRFPPLPVAKSRSGDLGSALPKTLLTCPGTSGAPRSCHRAPRSVSLTRELSARGCPGCSRGVPAPQVGPCRDSPAPRPPPSTPASRGLRPRLGASGPVARDRGGVQARPGAPLLLGVLTGRPGASWCGELLPRDSLLFLPTMPTDTHKMCEKERER